MGFLDAFALLALLVLGLPVAVGLGWLLEKIFRVRWVRPVPFLLLLAVVVAGVPLALRVAGAPAEGRVLARDERVHVNARDGGWWSARRLQVRYAPARPRLADPTSQTAAHDSVTANLPASAATYDRTPVGAVVPVTYVAFRPSLAKLADRTLGDTWRELLAAGNAPAWLGLLAAVVLTAAVWSWSPRGAALRTLRRGALAVTVGVAVLAVAQLALVSPAHGPDEPVPAAAAARVAATTTFTSCGYCTSGEVLAQPFEVVTLEFTPAGARFPVQTADAVDTGSVRGLVEGATVRVHYAPDRPRAARIDGATRTFETRNGRDTILLLGGFWLLVGAAYVAFSPVAAAVRKRYGTRDN